MPCKSHLGRHIMRFFFRTIFVLSLTMLFACKYSTSMEQSIAPRQKKFYAITAKEGLNIREKPSFKSKRLATIPYGYRGEIFEQDLKFEKIQGTMGFWVQTKYQ